MHAGCNKQVFSPNPEKRLAQIRFVDLFFREKRKNRHFNSEKSRHRAEG